jgi:hypothetical protein
VAGLSNPEGSDFLSGIEIIPSQVLTTLASRASASENQWAVTVFSSVKKRTASVPIVCRSPKNEFLCPVKPNIPSGTGIPTLTPTMPPCVRLANSRAK